MKTPPANLFIVYTIILSLCMSPCILHATSDNPFFYRAPQFFGEPRLSRDQLSSVEVSITSGSTRKSRNCAGQKTCLLDIYGPSRMIPLGEGVPGKNPSNPADLALINLALLPENGTFAELGFQGAFHTTQADIWFTQNFARGLFVQAFIPYQTLEISCTNYRDLSPTTACSTQCPNDSSAEWQTFLNLFPAILRRYNLTLNPVSKRGIGAVTLSGGWAASYQGNEFDFFDATLAAGVILPTGGRKNPNIVFDLPLGYDGHTGASFSVDLSAGLYNWLTFGGHLGARVFNTIKQNLRLKTDLNQNGFIKLASGCACVELGSIFDGGIFLKADHLARGFSLIAGYSFMSQADTIVNPLDKEIFVASVVNSDPVFKSWRMHTIHLAAEYDFTQAYQAWGPRIGIVYNPIIGGQRIFNTGIGGGYLGIDVAWDLI